MQSFLDKVHIGLTKDSLSTVDEQLNVDDVCAIFGQRVKSSLCHNLERRSISLSSNNNE